MNLLNNGLKIFLTGSLMLFLHRLVAEAVRFDSGIEETLHFDLLLYIPSIVFIALGFLLVLIALFKYRNENWK